MSKKSKYNLLMMRDNSPVRRYRLSPAWLKILVYGLTLLILCAAGGGWAGFSYWKKNLDLTAQRDNLEQELRDARMELERLQNIDQILKSNDPEDIQSLMGSMATEPPRDIPDPVDLKKIFKRVDMQQVRVDNLQAKYNGNRLQVSFNLNNLHSKTLSGEADLHLVGVDGNKIDIKLNTADLAFQIQRFKSINTALELPKKQDRKSIFGLRLIIKNTQGLTIFSETYPLSYILA